MARPRLPDAVLKAQGAHLKDPQRFRGRKAPKSKELGQPPAHLSDIEAEVWQTAAEEMPWLDGGDRAILAKFCRLEARFISDDLPPSLYPEVRLLLVQLGATPSARSKVQAPADDEDEDPADQFFRPRAN